MNDESPSALSVSLFQKIGLNVTRAGNRVRTDDLLITNQLLYQLSYAGFSGG